MRAVKKQQGSPLLFNVFNFAVVSGHLLNIHTKQFYVLKN